MNIKKYYDGRNSIYRQKSLTLVDVNIVVDFPRDQKDAKFLSCALAADADYLITGDADFSEAWKLTKTTIISA